MAQSVVEHFLALAARAPERPLLDFEGTTVTRGQLAESVRRTASALRARQHGSGERVALFLGTCAEFPALWLGLQLAGAAGIPVNTAYREVELRHLLHHGGASAVFTDAAGLPHLLPLLRELPRLRLLVLVGPEADAIEGRLSLPAGVERLTLEALWSEGDPTESLPPPAGDSLAALGYTSGTTGRAKGAMLLHRNFEANVTAVAAAWEWTEADRLLLTLPLFHAHGLFVGLHGTLVCGGRVTLHRRFDARAVLEALGRSEHTMFFGVPTMYGRLVELAGEAGHPLPSLRLLVSGSAPLSRELHALVGERLGQRILERYGMTETGMNTTQPFRGVRRPGSVGRPFPGQEARVVHPATRQPLPAGETGEIEVRGPHVFAGYWEDPAATAEALDASGWFATGDLGSLDAQGELSISGRAKELIISGGFNVYPREVEEVLLTHPDVAEAAVLGLPHPDLGEQVTAVIVPRGEPFATESLVEHCRQRLAAFKKPREITFASTLPRNALGKVQKHLLREALLRGR